MARLLGGPAAPEAQQTLAFVQSSGAPDGGLADGGAAALSAHTHADLVRIARRWLTGAARCDFAFTEYAYLSEVPDALGFLSLSATILVECKTSRADFLADAKKPWRQKPETGLGDFRTFLAPTGLLLPDEIPERWGLLEVDGAGRVRQTRPLAIVDRRRSRHSLEVAARSSTPDQMHPELRTWAARVEAERWPKNAAGELGVLYSAARRLHIKGCWGILKSPALQAVTWHTGPCPTPP